MKQLYNVPEMTCEHCKKAIEIKLKENKSIKAIKVNLSDKTVSLKSDVESQEIINMLDEIGFAASLIETE